MRAKDEEEEVEVLEICGIIAKTIVIERTRMVIGKSELGRQKSRNQVWVWYCPSVLRCDWRVFLSG